MHLDVPHPCAVVMALTQNMARVAAPTGLAIDLDNPTCTGTKKWWHVLDYEPSLRSFTIVNRLKDNSVAIGDAASSTLGSAPS